MTGPMTADLGIYADRSQLDHDVEQLLGDLLRELDVRGVDRAAARASVRRVAGRVA